jgi:hypothetical protein
VKPTDIKTYEELRQYLSSFANFHGDLVPYDFLGTLLLFLALLDNLARNHNDSDFGDLAETELRLTEPQREFLQKLLALASG